MKITREKPEIIRIVYRQDKDDEDYGSCLYAFFDFDIERGMLNIQSDCGNYAYRWPECGNEFLELFTDMSNMYLLKKLCGKPREFDSEGTISNIKEYISEMEFSEMRKKELFESLECMFSEYDLSGEDSFYFAQYLVDEWNNDNDAEIDCAWELVRADYSPQEERIVNIMLEYIAPELEKIIKGGAVS